MATMVNKQALGVVYLVQWPTRTATTLVLNLINICVVHRYRMKELGKRRSWKKRKYLLHAQMCLTRHYIDSSGGGKTALVVTVIMAEKARARGKEVSVLWEKKS